MDSAPPPAWILPLAADRWRELLPQLPSLTPLDHVALAKYCQCFAQYRAAQEWMAANGMTMTVRNDKGEVKIIAPVPHVGIAAKMLAEMRHYEKAFGLVPSASRPDLPSDTAIALAADPTDEVFRWVVAGDPEQDIRAKLAENFPGTDPGEVLSRVMTRLRSAADAEPAVVFGWAVEATRDLYRRMVEAGDFSGALRAVKQMSELVRDVPNWQGEEAEARLAEDGGV